MLFYNILYKFLVKIEINKLLLNTFKYKIQYYYNEYRNRRIR